MANLEPLYVTDAQYQIIAARRQTYDLLVWQTPVISLTAQAFLLTIALGSGDCYSRVIASFLALITALASAQLLSKHRYFEVYYAQLLEDIEQAQRLQAASEKPPRAKGMTGWSSVSIWYLVFVTFAVAALIAGLKAML